MSDIAINADYLPEQHAPDPMISHGDFTAPGKVGIWLFLASEIMFFAAILGSYVILRGGSHELFAEHALALSKVAAGINTLVLIFSSLTMALAVDSAQKNLPKKMAKCLALTLLCAIAFMGIKAYEYGSKAYHLTIVAHDSSAGVFVYDGHVKHEKADGEITLKGYRIPLEDYGAGTGFDIHLVSEHGMEELLKAKTGKPPVEQEFIIPASTISAMTNYGPWKNIFYACYFTLTGIHGLHVLGGMIPLSILLDPGSPRQNFRPPHRIRRPLLALRRSGLDFPVPPPLSGMRHTMAISDTTHPMSNPNESHL